MIRPECDQDTVAAIFELQGRRTEFVTECTSDFFKPLDAW